MFFSNPSLLRFNLKSDDDDFVLLLTHFLSSDSVSTSTEYQPGINTVWHSGNEAGRKAPTEWLRSKIHFLSQSVKLHRYKEERSYLRHSCKSCLLHCFYLILCVISLQIWPFKSLCRVFRDKVNQGKCILHRSNASRQSKKRDSTFI